MITEAAPAKINLFLHVGDKPRRRLSSAAEPGGVHRIGRCAWMAEAAELSLCVRGPFASGLAGEGDNLVLRAARACWAEGRRRRARLTLTKNLPVASGIGGGQRDAAAALRGLGKLWATGDKELARHRGQAGLRHSRLPGFGCGLHGRPRRDPAPRPIACRMCPCFWSIPACRFRREMCSPRLRPAAASEMTLPAAVSRTPPTCCAFWTRPATIWKRRRIRLQPVIGEVLTAIAALPGRAACAHVGQGRHLFWHLCR